MQCSCFALYHQTYWPPPPEDSLSIKANHQYYSHSVSWEGGWGAQHRCSSLLRSTTTVSTLEKLAPSIKSDQQVGRESNLGMMNHNEVNLLFHSQHWPVLYVVQTYTRTWSWLSKYMHCHPVACAHDKGDCLSHHPIRICCAHSTGQLNILKWEMTNFFSAKTRHRVNKTRKGTI